MRGSNRIVLIVLPAVALVAAFWVLVLSPKRDEASTLQTDVESLQAEVSELEQTVAAGEEARRDFPRDYRKVVVLGKAVPEDDDQASLLAQLSGISDRAGVGFLTLELAESETQASPAPPPAEATPPPPPSEGETESSEAAPASTPAPATEAGAANLPIGAAVGPAGLPVMPYKLTFEGEFFRIADFMRGLDGTVSTEDQVSVDGRLFTIDGFTLTQDPEKGFPSLLAGFEVTTYLTPPDQGMTGGATLAGPAPVSGAPAPVSTGTATSDAGVAP